MERFWRESACGLLKAFWGSLTLLEEIEMVTGNGD